MISAPILSVAQMRAAEQALFDAGVEPYALMQRAGAAAAEIIYRAGVTRDVLVLCGPGNNGGDGFVIARVLHDLGVPVRVAALGDSITDSSRKARAEWGGPIEDVMTAAPAVQLVDALFGIGLTRPLAPDLAARLAELCDAAHYSYALDMPSGVESDAAIALSPVPQFTHCIALGAWKPAHLLLPTRSLAHQHVLVDIGITAPADCVHVLPRPHLRAPAADDHKYRRGLVCIVAGDMSGAAALSAEAAARSGAGYVRLIAQAPVDHSHAIVRNEIFDVERARALLVGPGLGRGVAARSRLSEALTADLPIVADADALWLIGTHGLGAMPSPAIITPHEGEFATLFPAITGTKIEQTCAAAAQMGTVVIHKGADTVIAAPDGRCVVAMPSSAWLSTAGTGDVLAGLCAGRLAVTGDPFVAACEAVWLHGEAARRAGAAFVADNLVACIPAAVRSGL